VFSNRSVRQLRDATIEELLEAVFSMRSVPRCYKQTVNGVSSAELSEVERVGW
jgi:hypothetical protein